MKKKSRLYAILACLLMLLSVYTTLVAHTLSKYMQETTAPWGDEEEIDYTVNSVFVVRNQDELFAAINHGYTYVQLDKDIDNPLIVTQKAETLNNDLILDLNGIEIQRNGSDPILNIKERVRLTVVDTSEEQTGGLYNPVGSVFNIIGGTLTVVAGKFESGPRYSEYYSYNHEVLSQQDPTKRTLVDATAQQVNFVRYNDGTPTASTRINAPIIQSYPTKTGEILYKHGNLYFDKAVTKGFTIPADTYCYYCTSKDGSATVNDPTAASWSYSYWVNVSDYKYVGASLPAGADKDDYLEIKIYGYEGTISGAKAKIDAKEYYAAIQMQKGALEVQSGDFLSYFGVNTTACVNAMGGTITVKEGNFSSRVPNATLNTQNTVLLKETDADAFKNDYFNKYRWANETNTEGAQARAGESYCILNGGDAKVTIGAGQFYSSNNNTVNMQNGVLTVGEGTFTKRNTLSLTSHQSGTDEPQDKAAAIHMTQGELTVRNTSYSVIGNYTCGIYMENGTLRVENSSYNVQGNNTYGIYSAVTGLDAFTVTDTSFELSDGNNQVGIHSTNGRVVLTATGTEKVISLTGSNSKGVEVVNGGSVESTKYNYTLTGGDSYGLYSTDGTITMTGGNVNLTGGTSTGIYAETGTINMSGNVTLNGTTSVGLHTESGRITMSGGDIWLDGTNSKGIYAQTGTISMSGNVTLKGATSIGIHTESGRITMSGGDISLDGTNSKGIYSAGGNVSMEGGRITLLSNVTCYGVYVAPESFTQGDSSVQGGLTLENVLISVGYSKLLDVNGNETGNNNPNSTTKSSGTVASSVGVFFTGANADAVIALHNSKIFCNEVGIALNRGVLNVTNGCTIKTEKASAIAIFGGQLTFADGQGAIYNVTSQNTRTKNDVEEGNNKYTNIYNLTLPKLNGNNLTAQNYQNTDGIYLEDGSFTCNGQLNLTHTGLANQRIVNGNYQYFDDIQTNSYAVRVVGGSVKMLKGSITANVGGGVFCSQDKEGVVSSITMGDATSTEDSIKITTTGISHDGGNYKPTRDASDDRWNMPYNRTGGEAIELQGGNITVYNGTFTAAFGNGVLAKGDGEVTIKNGIVRGNHPAQGFNDKSGPASCYGLKVLGGATVIIENGKFDGGNGGAFVTGIGNYEPNTSLETLIKGKNRAKVRVFAGIFGGENTRDAFTVYDYSDVVLGAHGNDYNGQTARKDLIQMMVNDGNNGASLAVCSFVSSNRLEKDQTLVEIYYGTYEARINGAIWNTDGFAKIVAYNTRTDQTIGINSPANSGSWRVFTLENNAQTVYFSE